MGKPAVESMARGDARTLDLRRATVELLPCLDSMVPKSSPRVRIHVVFVHCEEPLEVEPKDRIGT
jgi:hypothetical protein